MFETTKAFCDSFLERGLPGFDLAVYRDGECILRYLGGYSDLENGISLYCGMHLLSSPVQGVRNLLYRFIWAELFDNSEFERLRDDLKSLHDYNLTY